MNESKSIITQQPELEYELLVSNISTLWQKSGHKKIRHNVTEFLKYGKGKRFLKVVLAVLERNKTKYASLYANIVVA